MLCGDLTLTTISDRSARGKVLRCKLWRCDNCRPMLTRRVIGRALDGRPTALLTLTTNPSYEPDPDRAAALLLQAWRSLVRALRRRHGKHAIQYMVVWERTRRDMPHIHVLLRAPYIPQQMISDYMASHIGAPIVDIRAVRSRRMVARYVAKYIAKDPQAFAGRQRYHTSRDWRLEPDPWREAQRAIDREPWHLVRTHITLWAAYLRSIGYRIRWDGDDSFVALRGDP